MASRVLVPQPIAESGIAVLHSAGLETIQLNTVDPSQIAEAIADCQAVLVRTAPLSAEILSLSPMLRVVSRHGVGLDLIDVDYCRVHDIRVTYAPESNTTSVAEHTISLMCALTKNVRNADIAVRNSDFQARDSIFGIELTDKTLGIVGYGRIGRTVAHMAQRAFNMSIKVFDPYVTDDACADDVEFVDLTSLLAVADVLSIHVPATDGNRGLIGVEQLALMKSGAYLINCSRGSVVDEQALVESLQNDHLSGAGLDVFSVEPLPAGHPLTTLDNVIVTPHMAAHSVESFDRMAMHAAQGIVDVLSGAEPKWPVA